MESKQRSGLAFGIIVLLIGVYLLAVQLVPSLRVWAQQLSTWPMIVIGVGVLLMLMSAITRVADLMVPGSVVATVGGIFLVNASGGNQLSWSYAWALLPAGAGVGEILGGLLNNQRDRIRQGLNTLSTGLVLFVIFASFFGGLTWLGPYWPVLVIFVGLWLLVRALWRK